MDNPFLIIDERLANIEKCLAKIMSVISEAPQQVQSSVNDVKLSINELAIYLKKDKSTIHRYKRNGMFPCYQAGRTVYFKKTEVDKALSLWK
jgi:excisionase family DNA binding protein